MAAQYQLNNSLNNYHQIQNQILLQWINYCLFYMCISSQWEIYLQILVRPASCGSIGVSSQCIQKKLNCTRCETVNKSSSKTRFSGSLRFSQFSGC
jgi:hypothetical protein